MKAKIYLKGYSHPIRLEEIKEIHKKAYHVVIFTELKTFLYELDQIERIEVEYETTEKTNV